MNPSRKPSKVSLIGAPADISAGTRGASMGPEALRVAGIGEAIAQFGMAVQDRGNLQGPGNPWLAAVNGFRHLDEAVQWSRLVHEAVRAELLAGHLPALLGGDHSLAIGSISAGGNGWRQRRTAGIEPRRSAADRHPQRGLGRKRAGAHDGHRGF